MSALIPFELLLTCFALFLQYPWAVCYYNVWCYCPTDIQECPYLAPWPLPVCKSGVLETFFICFVAKHLVSITNLGYLTVWWFSVQLFSGFVKTSRLFSVEIRLMWRTDKSRQSRLPSTGKRICSTMRFLLRATITLRSLSFTLPGNLQGRCRFSSFFLYSQKEHI